MLEVLGMLEGSGSGAVRPPLPCLRTRAEMVSA